MPDLLTTEELAERLRVKPGTIRDWVRVGRITAIRPSRRTFRFDPDVVLQQLNAEPTNRAIAAPAAPSPVHAA